MSTLFMSLFQATDLSGRTQIVDRYRFLTKQIQDLADKIQKTHELALRPFDKNNCAAKVELLCKLQVTIVDYSRQMQKYRHQLVVLLRDVKKSQSKAQGIKPRSFRILENQIRG